MSLVKKFQKTMSAITGRNVNEKVESYTELLGQIVIGMDKALEDMKNETAQLNNRIQALEKELKFVRKKQIEPARWLYVCLVVLILMNIILGAALWIKT
ncbi:hypothetical protein [Caldithrix abyssi]